MGPHSSSTFWQVYNGDVMLLPAIWHEDGDDYVPEGPTEVHPRFWQDHPDPQKDLKIRSPRTIGGVIYGLYRGYNGPI